MMQINILEELFLSTEIYGYIGPFLLVLAGYYLSEKDKYLGIFMFILDCLFVAQYLELVAVTPFYWWHIMIILLGAIFFCLFPLLTKRR